VNSIFEHAPHIYTMKPLKLMEGFSTPMLFLYTSWDSWGT